MTNVKILLNNWLQIKVKAWINRCISCKTTKVFQRSKRKRWKSFEHFYRHKFRTGIVLIFLYLLSFLKQKLYVQKTLKTLTDVFLLFIYVFKKKTTAGNTGQIEFYFLSETTFHSPLVWILHFSVFRGAPVRLNNAARLRAVPRTTHFSHSARTSRIFLA